MEEQTNRKRCFWIWNLMYTQWTWEWICKFEPSLSVTIGTEWLAKDISQFLAFTCSCYCYCKLLYWSVTNLRWRFFWRIPYFSLFLLRSADFGTLKLSVSQTWNILTDLLVRLCLLFVHIWGWWSVLWSFGFRWIPSMIGLTTEQLSKRSSRSDMSHTVIPCGAP